MKYRILGLLDRLTGHRISRLCDYVWNWQLANTLVPGEDLPEWVEWDDEKVAKERALNKGA